MAAHIQGAEMKAILIPAAPQLTPTVQPFEGLNNPTRAELSAGRDLSASERRLQLPNFVNKPCRSAKRVTENSNLDVGVFVQVNKEL